MRLGRALVLLVAAAACEGGGLAQDEGVQLAKGVLDPAITFHEGGWWLGDAILWTQGSSATGPWDVWTQALDGSAPVLVDAAVDTWRLVGGSERSVDTQAIATAHWDVDDPRIQQLRYVPRDGSPAFTIERAIRGQTYHPDLQHCQTVRLNDDGVSRRFWSGPCGALQAGPADLEVFDHEAGADGHAYVLATRAGETGKGIHDVAPDGSATLLVPPVLGDHDDLASAENVSSVTLSNAYGAGVGRACWNGSCYLHYSRLTADGGARAFVLPLSGGREQLLPGIAPALTLGPHFETREVRSLIWDVPSEDGYPALLYLWDLGSGVQSAAVSTCYVTATAVSLLRVHAWDTYVVRGGSSDPSGLTVATHGDRRCTSIDQPATSTALSDDGSILAWLAPAQDSGPVELWVAERPSWSPRRVTSAPLLTRVHFAGSHLLVQASLPDGQFLSAVRLDGTESPGVPLAQAVFGVAKLVGPHQLLVGTSYSEQDGSGDLALVDLENGRRTVLASGVASFHAEVDAVLYVSRGRYASDRDGLWLRRLP